METEKKKVELKIPPKMVLESITKAMQKLSAGDISATDANRIAARTGRLIKNNFTIDITNNQNKSE